MSDQPPVDRPIVTHFGGESDGGRPAQKPNTATIIEIVLTAGAVWLLLSSLLSGTAYIFTTLWMCLPIPLFLFFVAIFALVDGTRMLLGRMRGKPRIYGLLYVVAVFTCWDVLTVLCGIAILVLSDLQSARDWYGYDRKDLRHG